MIIIDKENQDKTGLDLLGINTSGTDTDFYKDAKEQVYTFINSLPQPTNEWVENCWPCQRPMIRLGIDGAVGKLEGIVGTELGIPEDERYWPAYYRQWLERPQVNLGTQLWFCSGCRGIWANVGGFWAKVRINGMETLSIEGVEDQQQRLKGAIEMEKNELPDPGEKPSPDSTKCSEHHVWRIVKPYEPTPGEVTGKNIHICPKCGCGEIKEIENSEEQGGN